VGEWIWESSEFRKDNLPKEAKERKLIRALLKTMREERESPVYLIAELEGLWAVGTPIGSTNSTWEKGRKGSKWVSLNTVKAHAQTTAPRENLRPRS